MEAPRSPRGSPFGELAVQATSELLPLEPQVRVRRAAPGGTPGVSVPRRPRDGSGVGPPPPAASPLTQPALLLTRQDLQYATVLCEAVYYARTTASMLQSVATLTSALGLERPLTDVTIHNAAGQR